MAVSACVFLVIAWGHTEWNEAATEPAADEAENQAEDPSKCALLLIHVSHTDVVAMLACHCNRMVWPVARWVSSTVVCIRIN